MVCGRGWRHVAALVAWEGADLQLASVGGGDRLERAVVYLVLTLTRDCRRWICRFVGLVILRATILCRAREGELRGALFNTLPEGMSGYGAHFKDAGHVGLGKKTAGSQACKV